MDFPQPLVRGRLGGWFEGAGPRELTRVIAVHDGPRPGHELLLLLGAEAALAAGTTGAAPPGPLEDLLARLSPAEARLFDARYRRGLRVREIAALSGMPEGTVKFRLSALRSRIRTLIEAEGKSGLARSSGRVYTPPIR